MSQFKSSKKGFTLVELVIVIAILAILAAVAIPSVMNVITKARNSTDVANARTLESSIRLYDSETGKVTDEDTVILAVAAANLTDVEISNADNAFFVNFPDLKVSVKPATTTESATLVKIQD